MILQENGCHVDTTIAPVRHCICYKPATWERGQREFAKKKALIAAYAPDLFNAYGQFAAW